MYSVDGKDRVAKWEGIPESSVGAPIPILLSDEHTAIIAYYIQEEEYNDSEPIAIITFNRCKARIFGPPNDEAFSGHPLASSGLRAHSSFIIQESSWLRTLIRMNEVHPYHKPSNYEGFNHFVLSFHDSTFECIAENYEIDIARCTINEAIDLMKQKLN